MRKGSTLFFSKPPVLTGWAAVGGKKEADGPLGKQMDEIFEDTTMQTECWEKAETLYQKKCCEKLFSKTGSKAADIDYLFAGDLQAQCTASAYHARGLDIQYLGQYGACSTMAQSLGLAAVFCAAGYADRAIAVSSSHFCAAERQFRTPLDYGGQRTPTAQWTVTGAGACLVSRAGKGPKVKAVTFGRVQDYGVMDVNNMGAAMAPAAADTFLRYFKDSGASPADFDALYTGDLGAVGSKLLAELLADEGVKLEHHLDCGLMIYDRETQPEVIAGGSGAGCSAAVLAADVLPKLAKGKLKRVLFMSTGALMSQTTVLQQESIPTIAHVTELTAE